MVFGINSTSNALWKGVEEHEAKPSVISLPESITTNGNLVVSSIWAALRPAIGTQALLRFVRISPKATCVQMV